MPPQATKTQRTNEPIAGFPLAEDLSAKSPGYVFRSQSAEGEVVVKTLISPAMSDPAVVDRLRRDLASASRLDHQHIVRVFRLAEFEGTHYVLSQHVNGCDLDLFISQHGPMTVANACEIGKQVALGLHAMREQGLVHLAIRPSNLILAASGQVMVLGSGLAFLHRNDVGRWPEMSEGKRSELIDYLAPEAVSDAESVSVRADVYSLGCTLFFLLTGKPFPKLAWQEMQIESDAAAPGLPDEPSTRQLPDALLGILNRMTARGPQDRYGDPLHVAEALADFSQESDLRRFYLSVGVETATRLAEDEAKAEFGEVPRHELPVQRGEPTPAEPRTTAEQRLRIPLGDIVVGLFTFLVIACLAGSAGVLLAHRHAAQIVEPHVLGSNTDQSLDALIVATLGGDNGQWWLQDYPWMVPELRRKIATKLKNGELVLKRTDEGTMIGISPQGNPIGSGPAESLVLKAGDFDWVEIKSKLRHIRIVPRKNGLDAILRLTEAIQLEGMQNEGLAGKYEAALRVLPEPQSATDYHLRALIMHKKMLHERKDPNDNDSWKLVREQYEKALKEYEWHEVGLASLCRADYAAMLKAANEPSGATQHYRRAREELATYLDEREIPRGKAVHFLVDCWCRESQIYRGSGQWANANSQLIEARQILDLDELLTSSAATAEQDDGSKVKRWFRDHSDPSIAILAAYVLERSGWLYMDRWRVGEASRCFELATTLREQAGRLKEKEYDEKLRVFHNRHGIAMAQRYLGNLSEAQATYKTLSDDLREYISTLATSGLGVAEYRRRLEQFQQRHLNTMERQADCELFGEPGGGQAVRMLDATLHQLDDYELLGRPNPTQHAQLLYKKSLALLLAASDGDAPDGARKTWGEATKMLEGDQPSAKMQFVKNLVCASIHKEACKAEESSEQASEALYATIAEEYVTLKDRNQISRDQLDLLLSVSRLLPVSADRQSNRRSAKLIVELARLPFRENASSASARPCETLPYLRSAYDAAISLLLAGTNSTGGSDADKSNLKFAAQIMLEARNGPMNRLVQPAVVFYFQQKEGHVVLHTSTDEPKYFPLSGVGWKKPRPNEDSGWNLEPPRLPVELMAALKALPECWNIAWADNVIGLSDKFFLGEDFSEIEYKLWPE